MKTFNNLVQKILLTEKPFLSYETLSINLNKKSTNKKVVERSLRDGEKLNSFEGRGVYKIIVNGNFLYFCFIKNNIADAYVEFSIDNTGEINNGTVVQRKSENTKGFLRRTFLNYFSNIFPSVTLDWKANIKGKEFFKKLLKEATEKEFKPTIVNKETKDEAPYIEENFEKYWSGQSIINDKKVYSSNILFKIYFQ